MGKRAKREVDPQAEKVYDLESKDMGAWEAHRIQLKQARRLAVQLCRRRGLPPVHIFSRTPKGARMKAWYCTVEHAICLHPKCAVQLFCIVHEVAHHIHAHKHPKAKQDHGPSWVRVYIELLDEARIIPAVAMRAACRKWKIRY